MSNYRELRFIPILSVAKVHLFTNPLEALVVTNHHLLLLLTVAMTLREREINLYLVCVRERERGGEDIGG